MKKFVKIAAACVLLIIIGIQFVRPERTNPPVEHSKTIGAVAEVPENVAAILKRSCDDCHSNQTVWPWYSNVAPVSWSVANHVNHGREELNFSVWSTYSERRQKHKLKEICEQVEEREMPHPQYLWIHRDARLKDGEIKILCDWSKSLAGGTDSEEHEEDH